MKELTLAERLNLLFHLFAPIGGPERTTEDVAAGVGVEATVVAAIRDGSATAPDPQTLVALERFFGVTHPYLSTDDPKVYALVQRDLVLMGAMRAAGVSTVLLRGEPTPATRGALMRLMSRIVGGRGVGPDSEPS
jgi:hypothetical protein